MKTIIVTVLGHNDGFYFGIWQLFDFAFLDLASPGLAGRVPSRGADL